MNDNLVKISVIADSYNELSWDISDWNNENSIVLYKKLVDSVEIINNLFIDSKLLLTSSLELGVDILFSHMAIELQKNLGRKKIITQVAIPYLNQGVRYSDLNKKRYTSIAQHTDSIIFLSDKISAREELMNSRYWRINNSDHLIMVTDKRKSDLIDYARNRKVPIAFIRPKTINSIVLVKKKILEYAYPLIYTKNNYAGIITDTAKKIISNYSRNLLHLEVNFEEDKNLSEDHRLKKYSLLSSMISESIVEFNSFVFRDKDSD